MKGVELGLGVVVVVGRWVDEYSQAASGDIVVNPLPLAPPYCLCAFWALLAPPVAAMAPAALLICLALAARALASSIWLMPDYYTVSQDGLAAAHLGRAAICCRGWRAGAKGRRGVSQEETRLSYCKSVEKPPDWRNKGRHQAGPLHALELHHTALSKLYLSSIAVCVCVCRLLGMFTLPNWIRLLKVCKLVPLSPSHCRNPTASLRPPSFYN